ncbi:hypothetical protein [Mycobacterium asiaticum]|nr:hypothetical protein [Mycobacterium asiaticum]
MTTAEQPPPEGAEQPPQAAEGEGRKDSSKEFTADPSSAADGGGDDADE